VFVQISVADEDIDALIGVKFAQVISFYRTDPHRLFTWHINYLINELLILKPRPALRRCLMHHLRSGIDIQVDHSSYHGKHQRHVVIG
jgi:hypothetical protein